MDVEHAWRGLRVLDRGTIRKSPALWSWWGVYSGPNFGVVRHWRAPQNTTKKLRREIPHSPPRVVLPTCWDEAVVLHNYTTGRGLPPSPGRGVDVVPCVPRDGDDDRETRIPAGGFSQLATARELLRQSKRQVSGSCGRYANHRDVGVRCLFRTQERRNLIIVLRLRGLPLRGLRGPAATSWRVSLLQQGTRAANQGALAGGDRRPATHLSTNSQSVACPRRLHGNVSLSGGRAVRTRATTVGTGFQGSTPCPQRRAQR